MAITINGTSGISGVDGSAGTPALQGSDPNTGISFGTDEVNINTGGSTRATVDSSGRLLVGTSSSFSTAYAGATQNVQIQSTGAKYACLSVIGNRNNTTGAYFTLASSRSETAGGKTAVQSGDEISRITFEGADGTNYLRAAEIGCLVDGTPGTNDMPGRLVFATTADGASSPTEQMRITSTGDLRFNSGYGSVATAYGVRAWVNFNGKNTVSIRNSGNVSSITDQGAGLYRINFTTAMVDANYSAVGSSGEDDNNTTPNNHGFRLQRNSPLTGSVGIATTNEAGTPTDHTYICCTVVR